MPESPKGEDKVEANTSPDKGTTFLGKAELAAKKIAADGKVEAGELVDAGVSIAEAMGISGDFATAKDPARHALLKHIVTEARKFLVPILTASIGFIGGGGLATMRGEAATEKAVESVKADSAAKEELLDVARGMIQAKINSEVSQANWAEVASVVSGSNAEQIIADLGLDQGLENEVLVKLASQQLKTTGDILQHAAERD